MPDTSESINEVGIPEIEVNLESQVTPVLQTTVRAATETVLRPTDSTLSVANMPADAKAVGDALAAIDVIEQDTIADVALNASNIEDLQEQIDDLVPKSDIETTLETAGKVADSKATGDAISALRTEITGMIDTTLSVSGGIADAEATGEAIADAIETAREDVVLTTEQALTDDQKAQARENIGAVAPGNAVLVTQQNLTADQQEQARENIGAAGLQRVNVISASGVTSLPYTITDESITLDMVVVHSVLSNPVAQMCDWVVSVTNGSLTIDKAGLGTGIGYGGTDITLYLAKTGDSIAQTSTIKQEYATSLAGLYYSRAFEPSDANSIFASNVTAGRIQVYKSGQNISIRLMTYTFNIALNAGSSYLVATLPENCKVMLMQQGTFISGQYSGTVTVTASAGEISISPQGTSIPAGTSILLSTPLFNVSRDHLDQDVTGFTLVTPS